MAEQADNSEVKRGGAGPTLFYVMLAVIVGLLLMFLVLRPRGSQAGPPQDKKSFVHQVSQADWLES